MEKKYHNFYQYSTISALMSKDFYGSISFKELLTKGDFGIGTFDSIDGELIVLEGKAYQMLNSGQVKTVTNDMTSPFASLTWFKSNIKIACDNLTYEQLETKITQLLPSPNLFYAYKITGNFQQVMVRTVTKQTIPFPSLLAATKDQAVMTINNVSGDIVGFWTPKFASTIGVAGFHSHFISNDKMQGGHVFNVISNKIHVEISYLNNMELQLPTSNSYLQYEIVENNLQDAIKQAESQRK
ncbi:acetolactate decarboxylase [Spiroplasma endosymbiont of Virgichneumon dumeticola]|uniref:acetolactate decarboxylase n=1 Tax=Spiroplasma endosymbiont of Virgichneumon dumeticola TaxID=3139323 RepID=UPI0035C897FA